MKIAEKSGVQMQYRSCQNCQQFLGPELVIPSINAFLLATMLLILNSYLFSKMITTAFEIVATAERQVAFLLHLEWDVGITVHEIIQVLLSFLRLSCIPSMLDVRLQSRSRRYHWEL